MIIGCKKNDRKAQKAFVDYFSNYLFGISKRYVRDDEEAKDVLQEAFVQIFFNISDFRSDGSAIKAWSRQITINCALQRIRKTYRSKEVLTDEMHDYDNESPQPITPNVQSGIQYVCNRRLQSQRDIRTARSSGIELQGYINKSKKDDA